MWFGRRDGVPEGRAQLLEQVLYAIDGPMLILGGSYLFEGDDLFGIAIDLAPLTGQVGIAYQVSDGIEEVMIFTPVNV